MGLGADDEYAGGELDEYNWRITSTAILDNITAGKSEKQTFVQLYLSCTVL
ncbi:hypothetical protein [Paenibacillus pseudetheri]|uniref:Uncharacterized protein n=1 Tax=Paenibacillus pseudetheri TaxID=2897682 RepID=A0ABM9BEN1_9BACL|nr:hypothetical protein [Paenibacillus pseudetheri]CAH1056864.1 hypothetical protein PAECIP111894_03019 [Paenibacillus pseudetheri]